MPESEAATISFDLGIAALVGEGLYNFGELLEHPVVTTLEASEFIWLAQLLRAFNAGDIAKCAERQPPPRCPHAHRASIAHFVWGRVPVITEALPL